MTDQTLETVQFAPKRSGFYRFTRRLFKSKPGTFGMVIVILVILIAVFADQLAAHDPQRINFGTKLLPLWFMEGGRIDYPLWDGYAGTRYPQPPDFWQPAYRCWWVLPLCCWALVSVPRLGLISGFVRRYR
ncbi:MAG: hypothetical protein MZU97_08270 [Bacillus subtilis]|nr:hypothetical protein [Bacillus subtilis]